MGYTCACDRFIDEFWDDAKKLFNMDDFPNVVSCGLGYGPMDWVYFCAEFKHGDRVESLMFDTVVFDPSWMKDDMIENIAGLFSLDEKTVKLRLKKIQII